LLKIELGFTLIVKVFRIFKVEISFFLSNLLDKSEIIVVESLVENLRDLKVSKDNSSSLRFRSSSSLFLKKNFACSVFGSVTGI